MALKLALRFISFGVQGEEGGEGVAERLAKLLFVAIKNVDVGRDKVSYGINSNISADMRNWLFRTFGVDVSFVD